MSIDVSAAELETMWNAVSRAASKAASTIRALEDLIHAEAENTLRGGSVLAAMRNVAQSEQCRDAAAANTELAIMMLVLKTGASVPDGHT